MYIAFIFKTYFSFCSKVCNNASNFDMFKNGKDCKSNQIKILHRNFMFVFFFFDFLGGATRAQWEDVTGSTPLHFVNDCVNFTTTVSARFWLMDCRNVGEATKMATELYREAIHVPFMAK